MRFLLLTFLSVLVSCGQDSSSSKNSRQNQDDDRNRPELTEYATDVKHTDLLDVAMDVPVEISGNKIIFKQTAQKKENGLHSSCKINVASGEAYSFQLNGSTMNLVDSTGQQMSFKRDSGDGSSIVGSWTGTSYAGSQMFIKKMTFISENRLVMRTHCEG